MTWQFFLIATNLPHLPHLETAQEREREKKMTSFYWKLLRLLLLLLQLMMLLLQCMLLLLLLLLVPSALAAFGHSVDSGRWHSALINIKSKQVHVGLYRSASVYVCMYIPYIYVSVLQYLVFHFCAFISLFSSFLLSATCIFHWVHPWIASDSGQTDDRQHCELSNRYMKSGGGEGVGGCSLQRKSLLARGL